MVTTILRTVFNLLEPVGFIWGVLLVSSLWLVAKKHRRMAIVPGVLVIFMYMAGATSFPGWLLGTLESQYALPTTAAVPAGDAVVMLGGGFEPSRLEAFGLGLTPDADRAVMALELVRQRKGGVLVLGGAETVLENGERRVEADMMQKWLAAWKLPEVPVMSLGACENTHDEAGKVARLAKEKGWKKVILVTSAYHMPRAAACFRTEGVPVVCVPCDYKTSVSLEGRGGLELVPRYQGFIKLSLFVREKIGWQVYRLRGWISAAGAEKPAA